ncbi:MAG: sigma-54 dependent transcriptional regulator [Pseudomonadota bacterium]
MGSILIVDDDSNMRLALSEALKRNRHTVIAAEDGRSALRVMERTALDLIITDLKMPNLDGMSVLLEAKKRFPDLPVVMVTGYGTIGNAVEAMKKGAFDYVLKPCSVDILEHVVARALHGRNGKSSEGILNDEEPDTKTAPVFVTQNEKMKSILAVARNVAASRATVFVQGESGTGKEVLARLIHYESDRRNGPFVGINCAALPEGLLESELFGHEKGAFTGAIARKIGKFELAEKGTILLDEVSEMPVQLQAKLLRVLQENEIDRIGGKSPIHIDVRVIATTNRDIEAVLQNGSFREDLFYRLNVIPLRIPALRERREDIPLLCDYFIKRYSRLYKRPLPILSSDASEYLMSHQWKGNVRELENIIERAILLCTGGEITRGDILPAGSSAVAPVEGPKFSAGTIRDAEKDLILKALQETKGNRTHAAKALGISVRTLRNKLQEYRMHGWVEK